jgi:HPt (histidine-containing phosphotransfer) domain-containing protein
MTPSADDEIAAYVRVLAARFAKRSVGELPDQRAHYERLVAGDVAALDLLRRWAHRIHGTAGSLGITALSTHAADLEQLLLQTKTIPDAPTLQRVRDLMRAIEQALACHVTQESHD